MSLNDPHHASAWFPRYALDSSNIQLSIDLNQLCCRGSRSHNILLATSAHRRCPPSRLSRSLNLPIQWSPACSLHGRLPEHRHSSLGIADHPVARKNASDEGTSLRPALLM